MGALSCITSGLEESGVVPPVFWYLRLRFYGIGWDVWGGVSDEVGIGVGNGVESVSVIDRDVKYGVRTSVGRVIVSGIGRDVGG